MPDVHSDATLRSILKAAAQSEMRIRFYGPNMVILAEGIIAYVGNGIVAIKHRSKGEPDEFLLEASIVKVQFIGEYGHY